MNNPKKPRWLRYINLSDDYERYARLIPAALSVLPLVPMAVSLGYSLLRGIGFLVAAGALASLLSVGLSHFSSALGNRTQMKLWPQWPHDSPTNRWLHPNNPTVSSQQKQLWYRAITELTGLDIAHAVETEDDDEIQATINDAIKELRNRLWRSPSAERVRLHNRDYGFARNLTGLRPVSITFSLSSFVGCWSFYILEGGTILWGVISTAAAMLTVAMASVFPNYVRQKADHYAESFFSAMSDLKDHKNQHDAR